jgi:plastocyanin
MAEELKGKIFFKKNGKIFKDDQNAVIYVVGTKGKAPETAVVLGQKGEQFSKRVVAITKGQKVNFQNNDDISHNVFSNSKARRFDLGLSSPGSEDDVAFKKTGMVNVYCNIHPHMVSSVLVLPNQLWSNTDGKNNYSIKGVPKGKFKVFVWHPLASPHHKEIEFAGKGKMDLNWTVNLDRPVQPHKNKHGREYRKRIKYDK